MRPLLLLCLPAILVAACSAATRDAGDAARTSDDVVGVGLDIDVDRLVSGLEGPTQMIVGPDGRMWVAQLAGGENA